jgi:manganese oxidase
MKRRRIMREITAVEVAGLQGSGLGRAKAKPKEVSAARCSPVPSASRHRATRCGRPHAALSLLGLLLAAGASACGQAQATGHGGTSSGEDPEIAGFEDYRTPVGRMIDGELHASLEVRPAVWRPWGREGPALDAQVFAEEGRSARVPGPLLRVTAGTPIRLSLRNTLEDTLLVRGLRDRGQELPPGTPPGPLLVSLAFEGDSVVVAPGELAEIHFTPTVPGSFFYYGKTVSPGWSATPQPLFGADPEDRALVGVLIVDPPDEVPDPDERIFLLSAWADRDVPESWRPAARFFINGRSWPHTERLVYEQGDTIRWRVINQSGSFHPLHLHGFYFHVEEWSAQTGLQMVPPGQRPLAVTWPLPIAQAMRISWVAHEPGNWLFHCHLMRHMSWVQAPPPGESQGHVHGTDTPQGVDLLGGMVLGVTVNPEEGYVPPADLPRRTLRLHIGKRPEVFGADPGYGFVLQEGPVSPAPDSVRYPGSPIVLTRGEPTEIRVFNHADEPLGVHWHGLELESWADGVPGWSGMPGSPVPAIAPADSLAVRMTPPRAGTFIYHVHSEPGHQLAQGLYGPFLVLEPGETWDLEKDRVFLLGSLGSGEDPPPAVNGRTAPHPEDFRAGETYRLRFIHISPDDEKAIRLHRDEEVEEWTFVARDGADLPPAERRVEPAARPFMDVGTTFDVLWTPSEEGKYTLEIVTTFDSGLPAFPREVPPPHRQVIPFQVR